jgi:hypothetical protein
MLRTIAGVIVGLVVGILALVAIAFVGGAFFRIPVDPRIAGPVEQAAAALPNAPTGALLMIALSWFAAGLAGGLGAKLISGSRSTCWSVVGVLTVLIVINIFFAPFPMWMQIASVAAPLIGGVIAQQLVRERTFVPADAAEPPADG